MNKVIQINQNGGLDLGGVELQDADLGASFLKSLYLKDHVCWGEHQGEEILVEARTFPLVVTSVSANGEDLDLSFPYGLTEKFSLKSSCLYLDDWSRLCGENKNGVPFVFSKQAQFDFLNHVVKPIDYNTFSYQKKNYELSDWYLSREDVQTSDFWETKYQNQEIPWDRGHAHAALKYVLPRLKLSKSKILVAGCGQGHDALELSRRGHVVWGVDLSKEAIQEAQKQAEQQKLTTVFREADVFDFSHQHEHSFDLAFEHTFFCAISPDLRSKIVRTWKRVLRPGGHLMAIFMVSLKRGGPPYGITEWEVLELLEKDFKIDYWGRLRGLESERPGKELFVYAQRK